MASFQLNANDAMKLLICEAHIGSANLDHQTANYAYKRRNDGKIF